MCHQPLSDKGWLRQLRPNATPEQIYQFVERVGIKVDSANPPLDALLDALHKARMEAFREMGFCDVD